jgi:hypothetical protein
MPTQLSNTHPCNDNNVGLHIVANGEKPNLKITIEFKGTWIISSKNVG